MDLKNNKILIAILLVLAFFSAKIYTDSKVSYNSNSLSFSETSKNKLPVSEKSEDNEISLASDTPEEIYVHVAGEVKSPGLVKLPQGSRVIDAVEAAGGMYDNADINNINLAKILSDEDRVYIPAIGEIASSSNFIGENSKINLNFSTKEELMNLPNIGEKTADSILKYREKTQFNKIEDLMNVPGIGEKTFNSLKDLISV